MSQYPQIIDFSGHSHFAVNDPREIHQSHFTSVGTGSLYEVKTWSRIINPHISEDFAKSSDSAHMLVVEVDKNSVVRIRRLDVIAGGFFENDYIIEEAYDKSKYKYTLLRASYAPTPYFECDNAELVSEGDKFAVTFPKAQCDGERVYEYNVRILDKDGIIIAQKSITSDFAQLHQQSEYTTYFADIPKAESALIYAMGFWDNCSEPIEAKKSSV